MAQKIVTLSDARDAHYDADERMFAKLNRKRRPDYMAEGEAAWRTLDNMAIGILCRKGRPVFYAFVERTSENPGGRYIESTDLLAVDAMTKGGVA